MFDKHSEEARAKMSNYKAGRKLSEKTRAKISSSLLGQAKPKGSGRPSLPIEVIDIKNNITTRYDSISEAALALNIGK
jgi:NUMOD3 motif